MIVRRMSIHPIFLPFRRSFDISRGRIGDVGALAPHVILRLEASEASGWGEARPSHLWSYETRETVTTTLHGYLRGCIEGQDARDLKGLHRRMDTVIAPAVTRGQPIAKSGIDMAAHDLLCRSQGVSLSSFLGGQGRSKIKLTFLVSASSPEEAGEQVRSALEEGYSGFKVKIGKGVERDLEILARCRDVIGNRFLWADANQAYGYADALRLAKEGARLDLQILEQPLISTDRSGLVRLSKESPTKIAIDESVFVAEDLRDFIALGFEGAVVVKTAKSGGILPARAMIDLAMESDLEVLGSGLTEGMVGLSASVQLFHASGIRLPVDLNGPQFIADDVAKGPVIEGGAAMACGPGLGVEVDPSMLKERGVGRRQAFGSS